MIVPFHVVKFNQYTFFKKYNKVFKVTLLKQNDIFHLLENISLNAFLINTSQEEFCFCIKLINIHTSNM